VSSVLAEVMNPLVVSYVMTKFAVLGLARSLQQIVAHQPRVRVSVVLPGPLDTPMFQRAANHTGRELRSVPPASSPERAAAAVVKAARRAPRQVPVGAAARVVLLAHRIAPRLADYVVAQWSGRLITRSVPAPATPGVLRAPAPTGQTDGGWRRAGWRRRAGDLAGRRLARRHASRAA
jgi:NAD(P)-dependent dehydrogenase (short-subunit alcohol dehydrogenase family)